MCRRIGVLVVDTSLLLTSIVLRAWLHHSLDSVALLTTGGTPLADAVREGHTAVAKRLFEHGANLGLDEIQISCLLEEHARNGDVEKIKLLLSCNASVDAADNDK